MKRLVLIMLIFITSVFTYAQDYEVVFSVNKKKTVVTCKVKNNTKFDMVLLRGHLFDLKSYCTVYYISASGKVSFFDIGVMPDEKKRVLIKPGETHFYQIDMLPYNKIYHITKLKGVFEFIYQKSTQELASERITKIINFE